MLFDCFVVPSHSGPSFQTECKMFRGDNLDRDRIRVDGTRLDRASITQPRKDSLNTDRAGLVLLFFRFD